MRPERTEEERRQIADFLLEYEDTERRLGLLEGKLNDFGKKLLSVAERMQKEEPWKEDAETLKKCDEIPPDLEDFFRDQEESRRTS